MEQLAQDGSKTTILGFFWGKGRIVIAVPLLLVIAIVGYLFMPKNQTQSNGAKEISTFACDSNGKPVLDVMLVTDKGQVAFPDQFGNIRLSTKDFDKEVSVRGANTKQEIFVIKVPNKDSFPARILVR